MDRHTYWGWAGSVFFLPDAGNPAGLFGMHCRILPDIRPFLAGQPDLRPDNPLLPDIRPNPNTFVCTYMCLMTNQDLALEKIN